MKKRVLLLFSLLVIACPAFAEEAPLWELGAGAAFWYLPDYRGSDESRFYVLPFPYPIYRGRIIRADGTSLSGLLFESDKLRLDLSLSGSLPVRSDDNHARTGMPDLDFTVEIGPSLEYVFFQKPSRSLWLRIPFRSVHSVPDMSYRGFKIAPYLDYDWMSAIIPGWRMNLSVGPIFGTKRYHDYFYEVDRPFARPDRPEYHSEGGYSGSAIVFGAHRRFKNIRIAPFIRYDNLSGAAFEQSPLVKTTDYLSGGVTVTWFFARSKTLVKRPPDEVFETPIVHPEKTD